MTVREWAARAGLHDRRSMWLAAAFVGAAIAPLPALAQRLVTQGALVFDRKTDLTWQRCPYGQRWNDTAGCQGEALRITFEQAKQLESSGWRVPRLDELVSIVQRGRSPAIDSEAFPGTPATYFWATDNRDLSSAWYVSFEDGRTNHYFPPRTNADVVRFVRSGPWSRDSGPRPPAP